MLLQKIPGFDRAFPGSGCGQTCGECGKPMSNGFSTWVYVLFYVNCGQWPLTMRARCSAFRCCPDPLGIVPAEVLDILEIGEDAPAGNACPVQYISLLP